MWILFGHSRSWSRVNVRISFNKLLLSMTRTKNTLFVALTLMYAACASEPKADETPEQKE